MTDISGVDPDQVIDPSDFILRDQRAAKANAITALDSNPDEAARAQELSDATGTPPALVDSDLDGFEKQHKAALTNQLLSNNKYLAQYADSHPLAAKISNDDWGQLDEVSHGLTKLQPEHTILSKAIAGWKEGLGEGPMLGSWMLQRPQDIEFVANHRLVASIASVIGAPIEFPSKVLSGGIGALTAGVGQAYANVTGDEKGAEKLAGELNIMGQLGMLHVGGMAGTPYAPHQIQAIAKAAVKAQETAGRIKPFIDAGIDPPVGIDPLVDQAHAAQAKLDMENLDNALGEAQKSATRERNPEMFAGFIRQHSDARIGISAEAVRRLYGEKQPEPNDGILGWVPDIDSQLRVAEAGGGDISVPLAAWLARVEPDVAKELHDDIRVRSGGLTLEEAKEAGKPAELDKGEALEPLAQEEKLSSSLILTEAEIKYFNETSKPEYGLQEDVPSLKLKDNTLEWDPEHTGALLHWIDESLTLRDRGERLPPSFYRQQKLYDRMQNVPSDIAIKPLEIDSLRHGAALEPMEERLGLTEEASPEGMSGGQWVDIGKGGRAYVMPAELYTKNALAITDAVNKTLEKITPRLVESMGAHGLQLGDHRVQGFYQQYTKNLPVILWSLSSDDPIGTARHEAIHHLRLNGFFTPEEWTTLTAEAIKSRWMKKHDIPVRYKDKGLGVQLEEAVAEEFADWQRGKNAGAVRKFAQKVFGEKLPEPIEKIFAKINELVQGVRIAIRDVLGEKPDAKDLFHMVESGEIGSRRGVDPIDPGAFKHPMAQEEKPPPTQLEMEEMTRLEDRDLFAKADALGMTVKQYQKYQDLIAKRDAEDTEYAAKKAEKEIAKRQTKEWKDESARIAEEVKPDITNRPDIAADEFLRSGVLYGDKIKGRPRIDSNKLTAEQKALLPKDYYTPGGLHPDDVAGLFGYQSGAALVERLGMLVKARGELGPKAFINRLTEAEVERRMQAEHGELAQNILDEAKDHIISQTQFDMLHEETLGLATKAGLEMSLTQAELKAAVKQEFGKLPIGDIKTDKYLKQAGRAGTLAERALLEEKPKDAFKYKQQQYLSMLLANEAKAFEKAEKGFDRLTKQFSKREVPSAKQEYTNWIHDIMLRIGQPPRRSVQDIYEQAKRDGYDSLSDFVQSKEADLRELHVPDFLLDQNFRKEYKSLTADEFDQANKALKAMAFNARNELKVEKAGEKAEFSDVLGQMIEKLGTLGDKEYAVDRKPGALKEQAKSWWWSGITVESMLNRIDRDRFGGDFNQYIVRPFTEASNYKDRLIKEYQGKISALGKIDGMDDLVDNSLFKDRKGEPLIMRRRNVLGILQNVGNANNMTKLAEGYGLKPEQVMDWLAKNTKKEDWDRAQRIGDLFEEIFEKANVMSHQISGVGIERLPLEGVNSPFGAYKGWYNPIKYDPLRPGSSRALLGTDIEGEGYYRATTPQGYTKARTGYIAPVELNMDIVPVRMQQMLHDIAVRPAVIQMSKFFYNPKFKAAMIDHFGKHQAEEMIPFLRDFANAANFKSLSEQMGSQALEYLRQNTIANLIGLNPGTVAKHGTTALFNSMQEVGPVNWTREFYNITKESPSGQADWRMAMDKSEELQRRMRNFSEIIQGHGSEINIRGARSNFTSLREAVIAAGATPVSISDLLSAVPTWLAAYKDQVVAGADGGTAVSFANRAVRRAHGSSVLTNRPSISRTNALGSWFTSLYGFFSHMQQKQYELAWKAKDMYKDTFGGGSGDAESTGRHATTLLGGFMAYIIIPAAVEELVTPYTNSEKDSWGTKAAKTLALGMSSSLIGVRDFVHAAINLRDPQAGLAATSMKAGSDLVRDLAKGPSKAFSKEKAGNLIRHTISLTGVLTGLTNETEAKAAKFMFNYETGMEHPKDTMSLLRGLRTGTTKVRP